VATLVRTRGGVAVSAVTGLGLEVLLQKADRTLFAEGGSAALGALASGVSPLEHGAAAEPHAVPARAIGS
jgi:hypothetical protein